MSFLTHMCEIQALWKEIPFSLFFDRFGIHVKWNSGNDNHFDTAFMAHWVQAIDTITFRNRCDALYQYRMKIRQNLLACLRNLVSWNITGWWPSNIGYDRKLALVRRYVKKGSVCLQETKWTTGMACSMQHKIPGARVIDAPAIETDAGGVSGGVAVIVPSSFTVQETCIVVPGRVPWSSNSVTCVTIVDFFRLQGRPMKAAWFDALLFDPHFGGQNCLSCGGTLERGWKLQVQRRPNLSRERLPPASRWIADANWTMGQKRPTRPPDDSM